jgi:hypothetical protein
MHRFAAGAAFVSLFAPLLFFGLHRNDDLTSSFKDRNITTLPGPVGDLLRCWWREGTAAGNAGDFYDNRDAGHSALATQPFPQLQRVAYKPEEIQKSRHWGAQQWLGRGVVFGNSSTSASPRAGGSNPRLYYVQPTGLQFLYAQYRSNNLYVYPEHRDHDPGHNGPEEGFGDLYPTNTPYLLISQGSSGSDQPFLRALSLTLAAFRPEVKKKLAATGLLMPTVQMLFRKTNRHLGPSAGYLSPLAHPTAFEGSWINELALVQAAHDLKLDRLPPMVQLKVVEEDQPVPGKDYSEPAATEKLADTPAVIARVVRGKDYRRRLVVSAQESFDLNNRPLSFHWVVLRGDADKIAIRPRNIEHSVVEVVVPYHARRPIAPGSALESNRVDIGVFVNNGTQYSAPGFVTLFTLDNEARTYGSQGRILEIGYDMGETDVSVADWPRFCSLLAADSPASKYLSLSSDVRALLAAAATKLNDLHQATDTGAASYAPAEFTRTVGQAARELLQAALDSRDLVPRYGRDHPQGSDEFCAIQRDLAKMGLWPRGAEAGPYKLLGSAPTTYERMLIQRANAALLSRALLPGALSVRTPTNYVDQRLTNPKAWRDVYHYDVSGNYLGWTRYGEEAPLEFNADGAPVPAGPAPARE